MDNKVISAFSAKHFFKNSLIGQNSFLLFDENLSFFSGMIYVKIQAVAVLELV